MARITRSGAWGRVCKVVQEAACPLLLPLPSPPSCALFSFPSLEKKGLLAFYLVSISMKRFLIPYCALRPPRWATLPGGSLGGAASSAPWGTSPTARLPSPHKHPQLSSERNDISKSAGTRDVCPEETPSALPELGCPSPQRSPVSSAKKEEWK